MKNERNRVPNLVGTSSDGENRWRGKSSREMVGHDFWNFVGSAINKEFSEDSVKLLNNIQCCLVAVDPRIWPFSMTQILANQGDMAFALGSVISMLDSPRVGPNGFRTIAKFLIDNRNQTEDELASMMSTPPEWYEIYGREIDERALLLLELVTFDGFHSARAVVISKRLRGLGVRNPHVSWFITGLLLDLDLNEDQVFAMVLTMFFPMLLSHAYDRSREPVSILDDIRGEK